MPLQQACSPQDRLHGRAVCQCGLAHACSYRVYRPCEVGVSAYVGVQQAVHPGTQCLGPQQHALYWL